MLRHLRFALAVALDLALVLAVGAEADAPVVCARGAAGAFFVTLLADPSPIRVGDTTTLGALVQRRDGEAPLLDAKVRLRLEPPASAVSIAPIEAEATTAASTNKLIYSARVRFAATGPWRVTIGVARAGESGALTTDLTVAEAGSPLAGLWPYLVAPFAALGLFALHQTLARRTGSK